MSPTSAPVQAPVSATPKAPATIQERAKVKRPVLGPWVRSQPITAGRHLEALHPFTRGEFPAGVATPSEGHIRAANNLITALRTGLFTLAAQVGKSAAAATTHPNGDTLRRLVFDKEQSHRRVQSIERIWDFYFELFGQRQSRYGPWLVACDRIALDCYQDAYTGIKIPKSIPAPPPFSYMRTGFSPATFRRGIPLRKLGRLANPFPLVQLPYHRLVNPWTLGAVLHELSHNLQSDLGLSMPVPRNIARELLRAGLPESIAALWTRWNREMFADLSGLLLGGPAIVASLMDVVGRSQESTLAFNSRGVHPTPYLRLFLSVELLRRMGFPEHARRYQNAWTAIYRDPRAGSIPAAVIDTFPEAVRVVVDVVCFQPYAELGGKSLAEVYCFTPKEQLMVEEAAQRLAVGIDPGVVPERFLIGAARVALDRKLATPARVAENFYGDLARR